MDDVFPFITPKAKLFKIPNHFIMDSFDFTINWLNVSSIIFFSGN